MKRSDSIAELAKALHKAQSVMGNALMSGNNTHFKARYATLADVISAIRKPLTDNGLSWSQFTDDMEGGVCVETMLLHSSGEWMSSVTAIPVQTRTAHAVGSALMYARRYGLSAICGLAAGEGDATDDDDANTAATGSRDPAARIQEIVDLLNDAMGRDDDHGWWEIWRELKPNQIDYLHSQGTRFLSAKMKAYARTVEFKMRGSQEARDAAAAHGGRERDGQPA